MSGAFELHQALQPVVPVDDAAVEVVQVRGREAAAVERHERAEVRRDHRDDLEDHPLRACCPSCLNAEITFRRFASFFRLRLARRLLHLDAQVDEELARCPCARGARGWPRRPCPPRKASGPYSSYALRYLPSESSSRSVQRSSSPGSTTT